MAVQSSFDTGREGMLSQGTLSTPFHSQTAAVCSPELSSVETKCVCCLVAAPSLGFQKCWWELGGYGARAWLHPLQGSARHRGF